VQASSRAPAILSPSQRFTIEKELQQLSPFASPHGPKKPAHDRWGPRRHSAAPFESPTAQPRLSEHLRKPSNSPSVSTAPLLQPKVPRDVGTPFENSSPARSPAQPVTPSGNPSLEAKDCLPARTGAAAAAAAVAAVLSPHRPSSTHSSPCLSMRGESSSV